MKELEELKLITKIQNPHKTRPFIINKHSEITRRKSKMVFNYKRLNDNTKDDKYPFPNKEILINKIKATFIYNKFDLKSEFWQVLLAKESSPWTAFIT